MKLNHVILSLAEILVTSLKNEFIASYLTLRSQLNAKHMRKIVCIMLEHDKHFQ